MVIVHFNMCACSQTTCHVLALVVFVPGYALVSFPGHVLALVPGYALVSFPGHVLALVPGHALVSFPGHVLALVPGYALVSFPGHALVSFPVQFPRPCSSPIPRPYMYGLFLSVVYTVSCFQATFHVTCMGMRLKRLDQVIKGGSHVRSSQ